MGTFIFEKTGIANEAYFLISEQGQAGSHTTVKLGAEILERMIRNCQFQLKQIKIPVSNEIYKTNIALRYGAGQEFPISGFPKCLISPTRHSKGIFKNAVNPSGHCLTSHQDLGEP